MRSGDALELLAHGVGDQTRRAFHDFQRDIAGESVGDHDVDLVGKNIVPFDETDVVDIARRAIKLCAAWTTSLPLISSSPMLSRPTRGRS